MQHVEFFHNEHFEFRYHRKKPRRSLTQFIDYFWETDFDPLYKQYPDGFSDALFPNIGYTYLVNLGTPFTMQLGNEKFEVKSDGFLPRHKHMICHHTEGNRIFGIKFRVSPIVFEKKINFSEYKEFIFPLAYLIDRKIIDQIRKAANFDSRIQILSDHYQEIIDRHSGNFRQVDVVTQILKDCNDRNDFSVSIEELSLRYDVSSRTLQRYFEAATSISSKKALQIMRIRKAIEELVRDPAAFDSSRYGYYDHSHFYKHLRSFVSRHSIDLVKPHLQLLKGSATE